MFGASKFNGVAAWLGGFDTSLWVQQDDLSAKTTWAAGEARKKKVNEWSHWPLAQYVGQIEIIS